MSRNFGLRKVHGLVGGEDSAVAAWSLILALALSLVLIAASLVLA